MLPQDLREPGTRSPIELSKLLIVEGQDAFQFFKALLQSLNLLAEVEIRNAGGITQWANFLRTLPVTAGFQRVESIGAVRDAEHDCESAFLSICGALARAGLSVPSNPMVTAGEKPRVSVFILPDCSSSGQLEDLCLQSVVEDPAFGCVEEYFNCLHERQVALGNRSKARTQAFLSSRNRAGLLLGQAAHAGYWPWQHPAFQALTSFLRSL